MDKKCKNIINSLEEYLNDITLKCEKNMPIIKNPVKINDSNIIIPTIKSYNELIKYNYNLVQLKSFAKYYKLKMGGNKQEIISRIYCYLRLSYYAIKIQKEFRRSIVKKYKQLHGPAIFNRKICTNSDDFVSMEPIEEINFHQFISYNDKDGFIYGFDINSLHNLSLNSLKEIKNPYNRNEIPEMLFNNIRSIIRLGKILGIEIDLKFEDDSKNVSAKKAIELKALSLFQTIDLLGNYSDANWFLRLNKYQLIKFLRELKDIWNYRAQITNETKLKVCPLGDPFRHVNIDRLNAEENVLNIINALLKIIDKLINSGVDRDSKALGAYYVLGSLTLVSNDAASSMPWLFQSVNYF